MTSNAARAALAIALVVAAVVLFVVLKDDGGDDSTTAGNGAATTTTGGAGNGGQSEKPQPPPPPAVVVRDGAPVGGVAEIDATSGGQVRFTVRSDEPGQVHVHGYDIERPVQAGRPLEFSFPADLEGGYEIELHGEQSGEFQIADLTVSPG